MVEHAADFEWRGEGEDAEIILYAPDAATAQRAFEQTLIAADLPGVLSPVQAAASNSDLGWISASETHVTPDLISAPARGLLLVAASAAELGVPPGEAESFILRNLSEVSLPRLGEPEVRRAAEAGAFWAAEEGLISEDDLALFGYQSSGEPDALPRRALSAGVRDLDRPGRTSVYGIAEILDTERAEALDLSTGALVLSVETGPEDLGRLALTAHRERILDRVWSEDFGATTELPAAPLETEEAADLLVATQAIANYADARAALRLYELRRALAGEDRLEWRTAWRLGGLVQEDGLLFHRRNLAALEREDALVARSFVAVGTGAMRASAPPFGSNPEGDSWVWEEAGLLERVASLGPVES
jgi:tRNA-splicing ligase RtcB (3'-phosphate/5'-hydroxy nucleic acid ligase)